jgi:hypothetical protein
MPAVLESARTDNPDYLPFAPFGHFSGQLTI